MRTVALLGCTGQIGTHLHRLLHQDDYILWAPTRSQLDLTNLHLVRQELDSVNPDIIINAAAYTDVDGAEDNRTEAYTLNCELPEELAHAATKLGIPLIHYSTDYVFDGKKTEPYTEEDDTNPQNEYGTTKLMGELAIKNTCALGVIFRTSWVYSGIGNNFYKTMRDLLKVRSKLAVVNDQTGTPNYAGALARATVQYMKTCRMKPVEIVNLSCSGHTTWYGFAHAIRHSDKRTLDVNLMPCSTKYYDNVIATKKVAERPVYSVLSNEKLTKRGVIMKSWYDELDEYTKNPYQVIEKYEGFVLSVEKDTFWVRGTNLAGVDHEMEVVTKKIPLEKHRYIEAGTYMVITILEDKYTKNIKVDIDFRAMDFMSEEDRQTNLIKAEKLLKLLKDTEK